jgi:2-methylcitrate dehydratase PrpD
MLLHGRVDLASFHPEAIAEERVLALARKVRYEVASFATFPQAFPGAARVVLRGGEALEAEVLHQRGSPENPLSEADVCDKFCRNAALALPDAAVRRLQEGILALDERDGVRDLVAPSR